MTKNLHELKPGTKITRKMMSDWARQEFPKKFVDIKIREMKAQGKGWIEMWIYFNRFLLYCQALNKKSRATDW